MTHVIITGGSSGIGLAIARQYVDRGARVSLIARGQDRLTAAALSLESADPEGESKARDDVLTEAVDVADGPALVAAIGRLVAAAGECDVLVTAAGLARPGHFLELDDEIFRTMIEVDYFGTLTAIRAVAPAMVARGNGSIVSICSGTAVLGFYGYTAYAPAKFAVRGLMEALRSELAPTGVHVACVYPPDVDTPQLADENQYKPAETFAISGSVKPITADQVATAVLRAIDHRRFAVYPDRSIALLAALAPLFAPLVRALTDHKVRQTR